MERRPIAHELLDVDRILFQFFHPGQFPNQDRSEDGARVVRFLSGLQIQYTPSILTLQQQDTNSLDQLTAGMRIPDVEIWTVSTPLAASANTSLLTILRSDGSFHVVVFVEHVDLFAPFEVALRRLLPPSSRNWNVIPICMRAPDRIDLESRMPLYCLAEAEDSHALALKPSTVAVVRPDQYVGWCSGVDDTKGLETYLRGIFI